MHSTNNKRKMKVSGDNHVVVFVATILLLISIQVNLLWEEMPNASAAGNFSVVARIGKTIGADIYGFEPSLVVTDEKAQYALRSALRKHKVLVFHDVADKLTPELQVKLTEVFGRVTPEVSGPPKYLFQGKHQSTHVKGAKFALANGTTAPDLTSTMRKVNIQGAKLTKIVTEATDVISFGEGWHTDLTFLPSPPTVAVLVGRELPAVGLGNTQFLDTRTAFDTLPETAKEVIMNKNANHTDGKGRWTVHPLVVPDDENSRHSLYVNRHFTREILESSSQQVCTQGRSFNQSYGADTLLDELLDHMERIEFLHPEAYLDISWSKGQMVIWEEKSTLHAAQKNYKTRREMHRTVAQ